MRKEAPLAFDLSLERKAIQSSLSSERAKARLKDNFHFYAKEYFAGVPVVRYSYGLKRKNGRVTLSSPNFNGPIRERYLEAALDKSKPDWFQRRCEIEYQTFCLFEQKLVDAKTDDLFVWTSPPPFEEENAAVHGFGKHSFVFVFQVEGDSQGERINCFALRNYLDKEGLGNLLSQVTGEKVTALSSEHLLVQIRKVKNPYISSVLDVQKLTGVIYESVSLSQETSLEDDLFREEAAADKVLEKFSPWIEGIHYLLKHEAPRSLIEREFHYLEIETAKALRGGEISLPFFHGVNPAQWAYSMIRANKGVKLGPSFPLFSPLERLAMAGGSCGLGSGFGSLRGLQTSSLRISYQTAESSFSEGSKEYMVCPLCGLKVKKGSICPLCHIRMPKET